ncbi:MAG: LPS export ABC transporter periplasmic protein LptC [Bacteroidota bacterium]|nr:LPS export ABC transporter periplasmic protein LptC [Bacteroidota bacterium]
MIIKSQRLLNYIIIPLLFMGVSFFSCSNNMQEIKDLTDEEELPMISVRGMKSTYTVNSDLRVQMMAPLVYKYKDEKESYFEFPEGMKIMFFDKNGNIESGLKSKYGIYYDKKQLSKAEKNVVLTNADGSILRTEQLFLDEKNGRIYSIKEVTITDNDGSVIQGEDGFESNFDFTVYRFSDVSGIQSLSGVLDEKSP